MACKQRTLSPPITWSCPTLGTCMCSNVETNLSGLLNFDIPLYFSFAFSICEGWARFDKNFGVGACTLHFLRQSHGIECKWLLNVTINDISVIHVTAHRCSGVLKNTFHIRLGSPWHFVRFVFCLSKQRHRATLLTVIPRNRQISVAFYEANGVTGDLFSS